MDAKEAVSGPERKRIGEAIADGWAAGEESRVGRVGRGKWRRRALGTCGQLGKLQDPGAGVANSPGKLAVRFLRQWSRA